MIISIIFISFFAQNMVSNFISLDTKLWTPLFVLSSLILIYPYFKKEYLYYATIFILGFLYDSLFSGFFLEHAFLFVILGYLIQFLYKNFQVNMLSIHIFQCLIIISYRILDCLLLVMVEKITFTISKFFEILFSSFLLNMIYLTIVFLILKFIKEKFENKKKYRHF